MARPRKKLNRDLPANLYRGDGNSWRYRHPVTGKFSGMGTDKQQAIVAARKLNNILMPENDLVANVIGTADSKTFAEFKDWYLENKRKKNGKPLALTTKSGYKSYLNQCANIWGSQKIESITLLMLNNFLDTLTPTASNRCRRILVEFFDTAISKGLCYENIAEKVLIKPTTKIRRRHTVESLIKIREHSPLWLQNAIDIGMLTTQRRVDIVRMKWTDIYDGYLHVAQEKTTEDSDDEFEELTGSGYVRIRIDSELQKVLDRCKSDNLVSPFIIRRRPLNKGKIKDKEHWTQIEPDYLSRAFTNARKEAGVYPKLKGKQIPTFHEIRALAIFLHKKQGKSAQVLAGHSSKKMTEHYEAGHEIVWNDVDVGITLPYKTG